jgi:hypothetical protein
MSKKSSNFFEEVITNAKSFVERHKGMWDHFRWENFLNETRKKGVTITESTSNHLGSLLESLKKLYERAPQFNEIINNAKSFVEKQKGVWDHTRWESFISEIQKKGIVVTEETSTLIGSLLESFKKFYIFSPKTEEKKGETKKSEATQKLQESKKIESPVAQRTETPVAQRAETPVAQRAETPVAQRAETPVLKKQEAPIMEKASQPTETKEKQQQKIQHGQHQFRPERKSLHKFPKKLKKHPNLMKQKRKPVPGKKKRTPKEL